MKQGKAVAGIVDATVPLRDCPSTGLDRGLIWLIPGYPFELGRVDGRRVYLRDFTPAALRD
jgi:hypothetical protein